MKITFELPIEQEKMKRRCDLNFIDNCRAHLRRNKAHIEKLQQFAQVKRVRKGFNNID
jgi:hypothetical protein